MYEIRFGLPIRFPPVAAAGFLGESVVEIVTLEVAAPRLDRCSQSHSL